mmetsp:Transcript_8881/g.23181  ORF Transcript_8881/g.23181 Transcript_8881/m.23181 type:complete len:754 (+) Transcript_8881:536-2797(+)
MASVRVEDGPRVDKLVELLDWHHRGLALCQLVKVFEDDGSEELHHQIGAKDLPRKMKGGPNKGTPAPVVEVVAVCPLARVVNVALRASVHDAVPRLSRRLPEEVHECVVQGGVVGVGIQPAHVVKEGPSEDAKDDHEEDDKGGDVAKGGQGDDEGLHHLPQPLEAPDQAKHARDAENPEHLEPGKDPVRLHFVWATVVLSNLRVEDDGGDGQYHDREIKDVPVVQKVPPGTETEELDDGFHGEDEREGDIAPEDGHVDDAGLVVGPSHERCHIEQDDKCRRNLESRAGANAPAKVPNPVLGAGLPGAGLEIHDYASRLLPLLLLRGREGCDPLVERLDAVVIVDDRADDEVEEHEGAHHNVKRAVHGRPGVVVGDRRHAVACGVNHRCHDVHPALGRRHLKDCQEAGEVVVERVGLVHPRPQAPLVAGIDTLYDGRDGLLPAHGGRGRVQRPAREPRGAVPYHVGVVVAAIELALEHLHPKHGPHGEPHKDDDDHVAHGGHGGNQANDGDPEPGVPLDDPQRAEHPDGPQGLEGLEGAPPRPQVVCQEGGYDADDDDDEVEPVPRVAEVGVLVEDEPVCQHLEEHLAEEDHGEDLVEDAKDGLLVRDPAALGAPVRVGRVAPLVQHPLPVPGAVDQLRLPGLEPPAVEHVGGAGALGRVADPGVCRVLDDEQDRGHEDGNKDDALENLVLGQRRDEHPHPVVGREHPEALVRGEADRRVKGLEVDALVLAVVPVLLGHDAVKVGLVGGRKGKL